MTENLLLSRIRGYMKSVNMPMPHWVALSGGPDSVCLLHAMIMLNEELDEPKPLTVSHCNFHLRGEESDRDEQFCRDLCKMLGVEISVKHFDTYSYMKEKGLSLEMAARELRYNWWRQICSLTSIIYEPEKVPIHIALGHHADDSIETMLMNLMRGTGIDGLSGIVPINKDKLTVRPLLCLTRDEIMQYLQDEVPCPPGWDCNYVTDHTNKENDTLRNQIRNQLIPLMQQMVPQAHNGMINTISHMQDAAELIKDNIAILVDKHAMIHSVDGFEYATVETGTFKDSEKFYVRQFLEKPGYTFDTRHDTWVVVRDQQLPTKRIPDPEHPIAPEQFDADKVEQPIVWRRWRKGDRIDPLGMNGKTRKLSDLFTDAHYLPIQKQLAWVVTDANDRILWVPGLKRCDFAKVTPETKHVITLEY